MQWGFLTYLQSASIWWLHSSLWLLAGVGSNWAVYLSSSSTLAWLFHLVASEFHMEQERSSSRVRIPFKCLIVSYVPLLHWPKQAACSSPKTVLEGTNQGHGKRQGIMTVIFANDLMQQVIFLGGQNESRGYSEKGQKMILKFPRGSSK